MTERLPHWDELPTIDLYLDQVLEFVNHQLAIYFHHIPIQKLSAAMVNNYVKHHHIEKPIKKRYSRQHIATLIAISLLKHVFTIQEIADTLSRLREQYETDTLYNTFVSCLEDEKCTPTLPLIASACQTLAWYKNTKILSNQEIL